MPFSIDARGILFFKQTSKIIGVVNAKHRAYLADCKRGGLKVITGFGYLEFVYKSWNGLSGFFF